jgi:hypothetical protein
MKKIKDFFPFFLILIIGLVAFRFLFFISFIHVQKTNFRKELISSADKEIIHVELNRTDLFQNKNGLEWKEKNKELVINGIYYEVIGIKNLKDKAVVSLLADKTENVLFQKYFKLNTAQRDLTDVVKLLLGLTYLHATSGIELRPCFSETKYISSSSHFFETNYVFKNIKPPQRPAS